MYEIKICANVYAAANSEMRFGCRGKLVRWTLRSESSFFFRLTTTISFYYHLAPFGNFENEQKKKTEKLISWGKRTSVNKAKTITLDINSTSVNSICGTFRHDKLEIPSFLLSENHESFLSEERLRRNFCSAPENRFSTWNCAVDLYVCVEWL